MKKIYIILALLFAGSIYAQTTPILDSAYLEVNNVKARFNAGNIHFWDLHGTAEFEVPKGSHKTSIFSQSIWIGGKDANGQLKLAADRYSGNGFDFYPGPISNSYDTLYDIKWNKVWLVDRSTIDTHNDWVANPSAYPNYQIPSELLDWPAHGDPTLGQSYNLAPFYDYDQDGAYDPSQGDYPLIKGDQALYIIMNDARHPHSETQGPGNWIGSRINGIRL